MTDITTKTDPINYLPVQFMGRSHLGRAVLAGNNVFNAAIFAKEVHNLIDPLRLFVFSKAREFIVPNPNYLRRNVITNITGWSSA